MDLVLLSGSSSQHPQSPHRGEDAPQCTGLEEGSLLQTRLRQSCTHSEGY